MWGLNFIFKEEEINLSIEMNEKISQEDFILFIKESSKENDFSYYRKVLRPVPGTAPK